MRTLTSFVLRRPRAVIAAWAIAIVVAAPFAARLAGELKASTDAIPGSPSERVFRDLARHFGTGAGFVFPATLTSSDVPISDPRFAAAAAQLERSLSGAGMHGVRHYWNTRDTLLLGRNARSALLLVTPDAETFFDAEAAVGHIREAVRNAGLDSAFTVDLTGMISMFHDLDTSSSDDLVRAERIGIPLTVLVLVAVFGASIAAGLPILLALASSTVTLAVLFGLSRVLPVSVFAQNVVTMVGLGVGVDYALLLISRVREERSAGQSVRNAVASAAEGAGHAVLVSGVAVSIGFLALFLVNVRFLHTVALGGVAVVATAVLATITLLPAVLILLGDKVNWPRRMVRARSTGAGWSRWAHEAMRRPWRYLIPALLVLAIFVQPARRLTAWNPGPSDLDPTMEARRGFDILEREFAAGWMGPVVLLIESRDGTAVMNPRRASALVAMQARLAADPRIALARPGGVSADGRALVMIALPRSSPQSRESLQLVRDLRDGSWADARAAGLDVRVGGFGAGIIDFDDELFGALRRVIPMVLVVTFIVLAAVFRSVLIPLKAIVMNLLAVLASYGFLVLVFQDGIGAGMIGLVPPGGLNSFIVLMLFTILFGLSMDYEVFLLSRVREEYERTGDNAAAVAGGLAHTGGLITSAALIMVVLFGSFGFTRLTATREFGLGLAFAVALDATLIRVVLVPILMGLMGRANWWMPRISARWRRRW
jgi:uncharacterized membrane protein YdfJ with MMPL/SSD domain